MRHKVLALFSSAVLAAAFAGCSAPVKTSQSQAPKDIASSTDGVHLGSGWYPLEQYGGETFRWVDNNAEITACPTGGHAKVALELEPGPSLGTKKMTLFVRSGQGTAQAISVPDRRVVTIALPKNLPQTLILHVQSRNLRPPHEKRILNFRVFSVALGSSASACPRDVVRDGSPLKLGAGWYGIETSGAEFFRWVNDNAQVSLTKPMAVPYALELDVEPGPGLGGAPLVLILADSKGRTVAKSGPVTARTIVSMPVRETKPDEHLLLRAVSPGKRVPGDSRILNFRVFDLHAVPLTK